MNQYIRTDDAIFSRIGAEFVALNVQRGHCYGFNETASAVWELLDRPQNLDSLCASLASDFAIDRESCRGEVAALLDELVGEGLARVLSAN